MIHKTEGLISMTISMRATLLAIPLLGLTAGCSIATAPFKATGQVVDWSTTSRAEADRNRGREIRKQEERERRDHARCVRQGRPDC